MLVVVSARVRGLQEAYQLGGVIVLPVVALVVAQLAGLLVSDVRLYESGDARSGTTPFCVDPDGRVTAYLGL